MTKEDDAIVTHINAGRAMGQTLVADLVQSCKGSDNMVDMVKLVGAVCGMCEALSAAAVASSSDPARVRSAISMATKSGTIQGLMMHGPEVIVVNMAEFTR